MPLPLGMMRIERQHRVRGRRTTIVLEAAYWEALEQAADELHRPVRDVVSEVCGAVRGTYQGEQFNQALRVWVVEFYRRKLEQVEQVWKE